MNINGVENLKKLLEIFLNDFRFFYKCGGKDLEELTLPIVEDLDLKRLAKEQDWQGFDEQKFKKTIKELDVEESPEELLPLLKE